MNKLEAEQPLVYQTINNMIDRRQLPHALIFYGDKSTSKKEMAMYLTKYLYAKLFNEDIETSHHSRRIDDNCFTNLIIVEPTKGTIKKDQILSIIDEASKSSLEDGPKVFIFNDADTLNQSSANSLLKFIEEPLDDIYIIFLVNNLNMMLSTIKSRCALLSFRPLNREFLKEKLDLEGIDPNIMSVITEYTQDFDEIKRIVNDESYVDAYDLVSELFNEPVEKGGSMILYLNESMAKINDSNTEFFISLFIYYLNDMLKVSVFNNDEIIWKGERARIKALSNIIDKDALVTIIKDALDIKNRLKYHINFKLNMDKILLDLSLALERGD